MVHLLTTRHCEIQTGTASLVTIPSQYVHAITESSTKAIEIWATEGVVAYAMNKQTTSNDAFLALPVDALGTCTVLATSDEFT